MQTQTRKKTIVKIQLYKLNSCDKRK